MQVSVSADVSRALKKMHRIRKDGRSVMSDMSVTVGKAAAYFCYYYTLPKGASPNYTKMQKRIKEDVSSAYGTKQDEHWQGKAYSLIKEYKGEEAANKWYQGFKGSRGDSFDPEDPTGQAKYEERFDKMRGIPRKVAEDKYLEYRKQNGYKVPKNHKQAGYKVLAFVQKASRDKLIKSRLGTIGLAKNSWRAAFMALGGKGLKIGRGEQYKFPKEGTKVFNRFGGAGLGTARSSATPKGYSGAVVSKIRYMDAAFMNKGHAYAAKATSRYMKKLFDLRKKHAQGKYKS